MSAPAEYPHLIAPGATDRQTWLDIADRLARPVLTAQAEGRLRRDLPVAVGPGGGDRRAFAPLEAVGRVLAGLAPWLDQTDGAPAECAQRAELLALARRALAVGLDPDAPDHLDFIAGEQCLVDASFLALALLRAPRQLLGGLAPPLRARLIEAMIQTRRHLPVHNNHLLFAALIEALLHAMGAPCDLLRLDHALRTHERWYRGDGIYSDGEHVQWDYYQSYVIHPYLLMLADVFARHDPSYDATWSAIFRHLRPRARRAADQQLRLIAPDGTFPSIGRSICYRCGAFHLLADLAWRADLPAHIAPAQVRTGLTAVIRRTLTAPETFDAGGWLRLGLVGRQPGLCESYITTGSLYLCATALLPLGLPPEAPFWAAPPEPLPWERTWGGAPDVLADKAIEKAPAAYGGAGC